MTPYGIINDLIVDFSMYEYIKNQITKIKLNNFVCCNKDYIHFLLKLRLNSINLREISKSSVNTPTWNLPLISLQISNHNIILSFIRFPQLNSLFLNKLTTNNSMWLPWSKSCRFDWSRKNFGRNQLQIGFNSFILRLDVKTV